MIDYSKWDNLEVSDDEAPVKPQVHRYDAPQSVTFGGGKSSCAAALRTRGPAESDKSSCDDEPMEVDDEVLNQIDPNEDYREDILQCRALAERALKKGNAAEAVRLLEKALRMGGSQCPGLEDSLRSARKLAAAGAGSGSMAQPSLASPAERPAGSGPQCLESTNGGLAGDRYMWSQTKDSLEINVFTSDEAKAKDVTVSVSETTVCIRVLGISLFEGEWQYKVVPEEDPDWEIRTLSGRRAVRLTVKKAPMPGGFSIVTWWRSVLKGEPAIDLSDIKGRKREASQSFAKAWEEAHIEFKERVKNRKPVPIDLGNQEEGDFGSTDP